MACSPLIGFVVRLPTAIPRRRLRLDDQPYPLEHHPGPQILDVVDAVGEKSQS